MLTNYVRQPDGRDTLQFWCPDCGGFGWSEETVRHINGCWMVKPEDRAGEVVKC